MGLQAAGEEMKASWSGSYLALALEIGALPEQVLGHSLLVVARRCAVYRFPTGHLVCSQKPQYVMGVRGWGQVRVREAAGPARWQVRGWLYDEGVAQGSAQRHTAHAHAAP